MPFPFLSSSFLTKGGCSFSLTDTQASLPDPLPDHFLSETKAVFDSSERE